MLKNRKSYPAADVLCEPCSPISNNASKQGVQREGTDHHHRPAPIMFCCWGYSWGPKHHVDPALHKRHINYGYRNGLGWAGAFLSLVSVHNETANIWSHLLGFAMSSLKLRMFVLATITRTESFASLYALVLDLVSLQKSWSGHMPWAL